MDAPARNREHSRYQEEKKAEASVSIKESWRQKIANVYVVTVQEYLSPLPLLRFAPARRIAPPTTKIVLHKILPIVINNFCRQFLAESFECKISNKIIRKRRKRKMATFSLLHLIFLSFLQLRAMILPRVGAQLASEPTLTHV